MEFFDALEGVEHEEKKDVFGYLVGELDVAEVLDDGEGTCRVKSSFYMTMNEKYYFYEY